MTELTRSQRWATRTGLKLALLVNRYRIWCLWTNSKSLPMTVHALLVKAYQRRADLLRQLKEVE